MNYVNMYETVDEMDFNNIFFQKSSDITFLVGAGISHPSGVPMACELMKIILEKFTIKDCVTEILNIPSLRFEYLMQLVRRIVCEDKDDFKKILKFFDKPIESTLIHKFLASMIRKKNIVATTNFDSLIERAIGIKESQLKIIINDEDFKSNGDPLKNIKEDILAVYKLHGSPTNHKTGVDTFESIITTIDTLTKNQNIEQFSLNSSKSAFLNKAMQNRILIVMGYSGGDDFDIVPMLMRQKNLQKVLWISHSEKITNAQIFKMKKGELDFNQNLPKEDFILYNLKNKLEINEVLKIQVNTNEFISKLVGIPQEFKKIENFKEWLKNNISKEPDEFVKLFLTGSIFENFGLYQKSIKIFELMKNKLPLNNCSWRGIPQNHLGIAYRHIGKPEVAQEWYYEAFYAALDRNDFLGVASNQMNIGITYRDIGDQKKALKYYNDALSMYNNIIEQISNDPSPTKGFKSEGALLEWKKLIKSGMARLECNRALVYSDMNLYDDARRLYGSSLKMHKNEGNLREMADQYLHISIYLRKKSQFDVALSHLLSALDVYTKINNKYGSSITRN